jgi:Ras-related protein Rab-1A
MNEDYDYLFKIVFVGDSGVGKSSLVLKYTDNVYNESFISTIGVDFKIHTININNKQIKLQIWDTAGQERFRSITSSYYKGSHCVIFVYDITDILSYNNLQNWINEMKHHTGEKYSCIIGNKYDKVEKYPGNRAVAKEIVEEFAKNNNMLYVETSAKTGLNIGDIFKQIALDLVQVNTMQNIKPIVLGPSDDLVKKICGC